MEMESIFLIDYVRQQLKKIPNVDFYNMCDNHIRTKDFCNNVPVMRIDIREATWDIHDFENFDDTNMKDCECLDERMWEEFEAFCGWIKEDNDLTIFPDLNGYRVLCGCDLYKNMEDAQEKIDDVDRLQDLIEKEKDDETIMELEEEIEDICSELQDLSNELKDDIEKTNKFLKLEDKIKEWVKEYPKYWKEEQEMNEVI